MLSPLSHGGLVVLFYLGLFVVFFSPVILQGRLLAIGADALYNFLPNLYSPKVLWDPLLFAGFPMMADPESMTWYPPAFLLSWSLWTWNLFVLGAYVAACSFTYGYVYALNRSWLAALFSGTVYGLSGFMIAHLGHTHIIQSAAWVPLVIWSLESLRQKFSARWFIIGSVGVALTLLGGQPQIFFYALILSGVYASALGWSAPAGRWKYYLGSLLMAALGMGLAAIQIVPTAELLTQSSRVGYSFTDYVSHSLPPRQALTMIFPTLFGGAHGSGALSYFGAPNQSELTGYLGLLPLMLAAVGAIACRRKPIVAFWLCVSLFAALLVVGDATPLARLIYHVPILKGFRAPARHFLELSLAVSVLSGLGVAAIIRARASAALVWKVVILACLAMLACVVLLSLNSGHIAALAANRGIAQWSWFPWANRAVGVPLLIFLLAIVSLVCWRKNPASRFRSALLLSMLIIDLGSLGWFYEWRYSSWDKASLTAPETASRYRNLLDATNQRLMTYRKYPDGRDEMPPNLTRLWGVPSVSGYNALILSRTARLFPMNEIGEVSGPLWRDLDDSSLNLMAVRYIFLPSDPLTKDDRGVSWFTGDMLFWLGSDCNERTHDALKVTLPAPVTSTAVGIVSRLACASQIPDGTEVARLRLTDTDGNVASRSLLVGRDSSEWAYDCDKVKPQMKHHRARIFSSYPSRMYDQPCEGHLYVAEFDLGGAIEIKSIELEPAGGSGAIVVEKLSLVNARNKQSFPIDPALFDSQAWRFVEDTKESRVYENLRTLPRAWLAPEVLAVTPDEALDAIKTSRLADGRRFDPTRTALVEGLSASTVNDADTSATATVTKFVNSQMEVRTSSARARFLITSDAYYPGWRASIDGQDVPLYRADYAIRGVLVPAGDHTVRFDYRPHSFYLGASISLASILLLSALAFVARSFHRGASRSPSLT